METNPKLTSSEQANLWSSYMADSMNICVMEYFLSVVDDTDMKEILLHSTNLSEGHIISIKEIFNQEKIPIPYGYTENDVYQDSPRLFSDIFFLRFLEHLGRKGTSVNGMALGTSYRQDIKAFYLAALNESGELYNRVTNLMAEKGVLVRSAYLSYPDKVEFIQDERFLSGILTTRKRKLVTIEINHLSNNIESNLIGETLSVGFAQVAKNEEVKDYFQKGIKLNKDIVSTLTHILLDDNTSTPFTWDSSISSSTKAPFSDKLMMGIMASLNSITIANFGLGISTSLRSDIVKEYTSLTAQTLKYANAGAKLAIKNGWLEKPPQQIDHEELQERK